ALAASAGTVSFNMSGNGRVKALRRVDCARNRK
ncbi:hypothetical protein LIG30_1656, partial [Burkholderia sp. lig30]